MNVCVIGDKEMVTGFALAGVKSVFEVESEEQALQAFNECDANIVIISDEFGKRIPAREEQVVVRVSKEGTADKEELLTTIKNAVGFDIKW